MKAIRLTAPWCAPCKQLAMTLAQNAITIEVVDTDVDSSLAKAHGVRGLPTILILNDDGTEVERYVGAQLTPVQLSRLKELSI